ncbi:MAG: DNA alkylation repair protein, partial [Methanomassiliicoccus sp.]
MCPDRRDRGRQDLRRSRRGCHPDQDRRERLHEGLSSFGPSPFYLFIHLSSTMRPDEAMHRLNELADPSLLNGMARYGIPVDRALGVSLPQIRSLAKDIGRDHALAAALWVTGVHEARMLATLVDEPDKVSEPQMNAMVDEFASWDICDQCCNNLFRLTPIAWRKALEWSEHQ